MQAHSAVTDGEAPASGVEVEVKAKAEAAPQAALPEPAAPFVLPLESLEALAREAGLQWVHSDADKVRAAQEAIAQTAPPVRIPRQPRPVVLVDEGPLVLVETRKDLSQVRLPFDPV